MSWTIEYLEREQAVRLTSTGPTTLPMVLQQVQESMAEAERRGTHRFLCDYRAYNTGLNQRVFGDRASAMRWLLADAGSPKKGTT